MHKTMLEGLVPYSDYKTYRDKLSAAIRAAKAAYFAIFVNYHKQYARAIWQLIITNIK